MQSGNGQPAVTPIPTNHHGPARAMNASSETVTAIFNTEADWAPLSLPIPAPDTATTASYDTTQTPFSLNRVPEALNTLLATQPLPQAQPTKPLTTTLRDTMQDSLSIVRCQRCQRIVLSSAFPQHLATCGMGAQAPQAPPVVATTTINPSLIFDVPGKEDVTMADISPKQHPTVGTLIGSSAASRAASPHPNGSTSASPALADAGALPKTTDGPSAATALPAGAKSSGGRGGKKFKGPADPDLNCAVEGENGVLCARSLTCKVHTMTQKRAVKRSAPYHVLLEKMQQSKAAMSQDGSAGRAGGLAAQSALAAAHHQAGPSAADKLNPLGESLIPEVNEGFINSDDEFDALLDAIKANGPEPLAVPRIPTPHPYHWSFRMRDVVLHAMSWRNRPMAVPAALPGTAATMEQAMRQSMLLQPSHPAATVGGTSGLFHQNPFSRTMRDGSLPLSTPLMAVHQMPGMTPPMPTIGNLPNNAARPKNGVSVPSSAAQTGGLGVKDAAAALLADTKDGKPLSKYMKRKLARQAEEDQKNSRLKTGEALSASPSLAPATSGTTPPIMPPHVVSSSTMGTLPTDSKMMMDTSLGEKGGKKKANSAGATGGKRKTIKSETAKK